MLPPGSFRDLSSRLPPAQAVPKRPCSPFSPSLNDIASLAISHKVIIMLCTNIFLVFFSSPGATEEAEESKEGEEEEEEGEGEGEGEEEGGEEETAGEGDEGEKKEDEDEEAGGEEARKEKKKD